MTQTALAAVIVGVTLVAWALFMLYLRARPEAAPHVESSLMSPQSSTGAVPGTVIERSPRARRSGDDAAGGCRQGSRVRHRQHGAEWLRRPLPQVCPPRLQRPVLRYLQVVRVPVPR